MGNCLSSERDNVKNTIGIAYTTAESENEGRPSSDGNDGRPVTPVFDTPPLPTNPSPEPDPFVQRIAEEIAEFREQLRRGQEQIQAMSNSVQNFDTTKSCPGLVELKETQTTTLPKPIMIGVTIATQTEAFTTESVAQTEKVDLLGPDDSFHDIPEFMETYELDEGDADNRYRLRGSEALSVIEESEHESEQSPGALQRKMSTDKGSRPKLIRMRNTFDDPPPLTEEELKSDLEYLSAASSLSGSKNPSVYNSLERPLHVHRGTNGNGDDCSDTYSTVSAGNTTYGSPISSPSSPTYLTPSQGSSSQETLTNHDDGDKTPINYEELQDDSSRSDRVETVLRSGNSSRSSNRKSKSIWQMLPIDNRQGTTSIGVIPDEDQAHMRQYAYDVTQRSCNTDAAILSRKEWRTLHADLDQVDMAKFKKGYGQEDDTEEGGFSKACLRTDLDEVAESYCEQFPFLAESIFEYLESTAQEKVESVDDLPELKKRFEELATTFRTDHEKLEGRCELVKNEHETAKKRVSEITSSLKQTVLKIRTEKLPGEIREVFNSMENWVAEMDLHAKSLERAANRTGRLDVVRRVFKMIEVMVLYVRILNTVCGNLEEERKLAKQVLEERGIPFPIKKRTMTSLHHNNNNHEKVGRDEYVDGDSSNELTDQKINQSEHILQRLLGPKQTSEQENCKNTIVLRRPQPHLNYISRFVYESYETIQREFHWPWDGNQTWSGIRRTFALLLMLFGIFLICRISFIPPCESAELFVTFRHNQPPRI